MDKTQDFLIIGGGAQGRMILEMLNTAARNMEIIVAPHHTDITDETQQGLVAIGDNYTREKVVKYVLDLMPDFHFRWFKHPTVIQGHNVKIGKGTIIMPGVIINSNAVIGEHCLINTGSIIEHDTKIGNYVNIQPGVITGGGVQIGDYCQIGMGAMLRDHISIGERTTIGMGSVVVNDIEKGITVFGNPAKDKNTKSCCNKRD